MTFSVVTSPNELTETPKDGMPWKGKDFQLGIMHSIKILFYPKFWRNFDAAGTVTKSANQCLDWFVQIYALLVLQICWRVVVKYNFFIFKLMKILLVALHYLLRFSMEKQKFKPLADNRSQLGSLETNLWLTWLM